VLLRTFKLLEVDEKPKCHTQAHTHSLHVGLLPQTVSSSLTIATPLAKWEPTHGYGRRGRQRGTFQDTLKKDAGLESIEAEDVYGRSRRLDDPHWGSAAAALVSE